MPKTKRGQYKKYFYDENIKITARTERYHRRKEMLSNENNFDCDNIRSNSTNNEIIDATDSNDVFTNNVEVLNFEHSQTSVYLFNLKSFDLICYYY